MQHLAKRMENLVESQTLAMARKSRELQEKGIDVISLSIGEPDFDTPDFIKEAAFDAIKNNFTHYTPVPGFLDLRQAICTKFKRDNNLDYKPEEIVVSTGAKQSIINIILALIGQGDEVLLPAPFWVSYYEMIKLSEGIPVPIASSIETDFKITPQQLREAITPKTKLFIFSSPCNPSGSYYNSEELEALAKVFSEFPDVIIVSDEIYEHINFTGKHTSFATMKGMFERTATINGVSKGFAMTGWRIGYMGAPKWLADACTKIQGQFTSGTCSISQKAAKAAILANPDIVVPMKNIFLERRDLVLGMLSEINGLKINKPQGAFYVFPDVSYFFGKKYKEYVINNSFDLAMYLLNDANVAIVTGEAFGDNNCIRISYATSTELLKSAMTRIKSALEKLV
jgi:aspartate aminotransferase